MEDMIARALAGDTEAQKEATDNGAILPCPLCYGEVEAKIIEMEPGEIAITFVCKKCGLQATKTQSFSLWGENNRIAYDLNPLEQWNKRFGPLTDKGENIKP